MKKLDINWELLRGATYRKQGEIAAKIGIKQPTLSLKLSRQRGLTLEDLNAISEALGRDTMDFIIERETGDRRGA